MRVVVTAETYPDLNFLRLRTVGLVIEGATTPWSWASLPGIPRYFNESNSIYMVWMETTRLPEPLSPEARALVRAARSER